MNAGISEVRVGFIPLVDSAQIVIAAAKGFDRAEGVVLRLSREASWSNIRDRLAFGALDAAHMLAPMALASALGLWPAGEPVVVPMALNQGGSAITVSRTLFEEMREHDANAASAGGFAAARALAAVVAARREAGLAPLMLGMVYPFSSHNYDVRLWLASAGIDPDDDVNLAVIPPPLIADSLAHGRVDGFCVGAPWNRVAVENSGARIVATKAQLWPQGPDKVLGVSARWAERNPDMLERMVRALVAAGHWLDDPANRDEAAELLSAPGAIGVAPSIVARSLATRSLAPCSRASLADDAVVFARDGASLPRLSHALWLLAQMVRWGQVREAFALRDVAARVYRADLYRAALALPDGAAAPREADDVVPDGFDPARPLDGVAEAAIRAKSVDLPRFAALNG